MAARRIRERYPTTAVASATCSRSASPNIAILVDALRRVTEGECVLDPTIVARLMQRRRPDSPLTYLTQRERDILALMA